MPCLTPKQKERAKELSTLKKKYKCWGKEEEARIKKAFSVLVAEELERVKSLEIPTELVQDFHSSALSLLVTRCVYSLYVTYL